MENVLIQSILEKMTLRELIGQTAIWHIGRLPFKPNNPDAVSHFLSQNPIGTIFVADMKSPGDEASVSISDSVSCSQSENFAPTGIDMRQYISDCVACFQNASQVPLLVSADLEHGGGSVAKEFEKFPHMMAIGAANDRELDYLFGKHTALEGTSMGINWSFSPVVDLSVNWLNPIVSNRSLGNDPKRVADAGSAIAAGMQEHGMAACAKHFPGDGIDFHDHHICTSVNSLSEEEWYSSYGLIYKQLIDKGIYSIMLGHIALPFVDTAVNKKDSYAPATVSKKIVSGLLREKFGYDGLIITDAVDMGAYMGWDTYENCIVDSLNSGVDAVLWPGDTYINTVEKAVADGRLSKERIVEAVTRIMTLKEKLGILDKNKNIPSAPVSDATQKESDDTISRIAMKSISLVRNKDGILPLDSSKTKRILIGNMSVITSDRQFPIDLLVSGLKARGVEVNVLQQCDPIFLRNIKKQIGTLWDALLMPFVLRTHGLINTVRPVGEAARAIWAIQTLDQLSPIYISFSTPYLLCDMPYMQTLVNAYSYNPFSVDATIKALFGEIPFNDTPPIHDFYPVGQMENGVKTWR